MTRNNETDPIRRQIQGAIDRICEGRPEHIEPGRYTVMDLVRESSVKRHYLTHRHKDLAEQFLNRVEATRNESVSETEAVLTRELEELRVTLAESESERSRWRNQAKDYKRIIQVLVKEREALAEEVTSLRSDLDAARVGRQRTSLILVPDPDEPV